MRSLMPKTAEIKRYVKAGICPFCGRGAFKVLALHTNAVHGVDRWQLRELGGFGYSESICDPAYAAECAVRPQMQTPPTSPVKGQVKHRISGLVIQANRRRALAIPPVIRQRASDAGHTYEANQKRRDAALKRFGPPVHGSRRMYRTYGCRCAECREDNARLHREYLAGQKDE